MSAGAVFSSHVLIINLIIWFTCKILSSLISVSNGMVGKGCIRANNIERYGCNHCLCSVRFAFSWIFTLSNSTYFNIVEFCVLFYLRMSWTTMFNYFRLISEISVAFSLLLAQIRPFRHPLCSQMWRTWIQILFLSFEIGYHRLC